MANISSRMRGVASRALVPFASLVCVNGLNYGVFLLFARELPAAGFLGFTTATAIVMLAMAIAEAGLVYAAPPFLREHTGKKAARVAGGFLSLSLLILGLAISMGAMVWVFIGREPLDGAWLFRCVLLVVPNLLLQNWILVRFRHPFVLLPIMTIVRAAPLLFLQSMHTFDIALCACFAACSLLYALAASRSRALQAARWSDLRLCIHLIRQFFVVRLFSTVVTSSAPLLLGSLVSPTAASVYLLGDRSKALVASIFQPLVQGLYLVRCRKGRAGAASAVAAATMALIALVCASGIVLGLNANRLNALLYASRHPNSQILALFVIAGHVSVLSSLGYFLYLIPNGHQRAFVRSAILQAVTFFTLLVALSRRDGLLFPAISILIAESLLLACIAGAIAWYRINRRDRWQTSAPIAAVSTAEPPS
jgi:O-antigen/teichoic acid export membrane protein